MFKLKRALALCLVFALLLQVTACAAARTAPAFADVPDDADYAEAVAWCAENGLMNGVEDGSNFDPDGTMTRAMLAAILYRQAGEPGVNGDPAFTDARPGAWYSNAVAWAAERQFLQGYGNGLFGVDDPVSREMLQVVVARRNGEGAAWTGSEKLAVDATRAEAAVALYETFREREPMPTGQPGGAPRPTPAPTSEPAPETGRTLVAYFSATSTTKPLAEYVADILDADLYEIVPEEPYTEADLAYYTDCRADREQNDPNARPAIHGAVDNMGQYDVVFIGYPIWHGQPPRIISTFLESHNFSGKTIVPFCTSHSSGYSDNAIRPLAPNANWLTGRRFAAGTSRSIIEEWLDGLELPRQEENKMYIQIGNICWTATLERNSSAAAFKELLAKGAVTVEMHDYGGFEKVGSLGVALPQNDAQITTKPGDIILYQGNSVTIYYDENSWNFTRLGHLDGVSDAELRQVLKAGGENVSVTFSLEPIGVGIFDFESKSVLLNSGYTMPINGLGTYSLHGETCVKAVKAALAGGVRLIDTASAYGNEEEVGQAVREAMDELGIRREEIFVVTKLYPGSEMAEPEKAIRACLERLNIGYVDMMLLHHPDPNDVKAYKAMEKFAETEEIRSLGLSNWYVEELTDFLPQVTVTPALVQNEIHPYYQENNVIPFIQSKGIVVQGWYPLGGRGHTKELLGDETISVIAQAHGVSSAQAILRWNLQKGVVVIPGSSNPEHIRENTELYHFELTGEEMTQINALDRNEKHDWY